MKQQRLRPSQGGAFARAVEPVAPHGPDILLRLSRNSWPVGTVIGEAAIRDIEEAMRLGYVVDNRSWWWPTVKLRDELARCGLPFEVKAANFSHPIFNHSIPPEAAPIFAPALRERSEKKKQEELDDVLEWTSMRTEKTENGNLVDVVRVSSISQALPRRAPLNRHDRMNGEHVAALLMQKGFSSVKRNVDQLAIDAWLSTSHGWRVFRIFSSAVAPHRNTMTSEDIANAITLIAQHVCRARQWSAAWKS